MQTLSHLGATVHLLRLLVAGEQDLEVNGELVQLRRGDVFLVARGSRIRLLGMSPEVTYLRLFFEPLEGDEELREAVPPAQCRGESWRLAVPTFIHATRAAAVAGMMHRMERLDLEVRQGTVRSASVLMDWRMESLLREILLEMAMNPLSAPEGARPHPRAVEKVLRAMQTEISRTRTLGEWAQLAGVSVTTLTRQFRRSTGHSIQYYQTQLRMEQGKDWLRRAPETRLADLAERLGFCDAFHFSRAFHRHVGVSPSEFRSWLLAP